MESAVVTQGAGPDDIRYLERNRQFQIIVDGKPFDISTLEAVMLVLMHRYTAMSDATAEKTREMQEQVNQIKEANGYLNAVTAATLGREFEHPPGAAPAGSFILLMAWMLQNNLDNSSYNYPLTIEDFKKLQTQISNYVDQLSSNNDLRMLTLKTAVNKAQQALTAADGILQNIKQLMQTITSNMAR